MSVLDHQMKELENYRSAVHKMGQDILALRQQIRELEANNSQLRRDLANYNDASKLMIESSELDNLTKPEVMSRYGKQYLMQKYFNYVFVRVVFNDEQFADTIN